jgi:hypothetical protein
MQRLGLAGWVAVVAVLGGAGCQAGAVEPFFSAKDLTPAPPEALGRWMEVKDGDDTVTLDISAGDPVGSLVVSATMDGVAQPFHAVVFRAGGAALVDLQLVGDAPATKALAPYVVRPHFLARAEVLGDELRVRFPDKDRLKALATDKRNALRFVGVPSTEGARPPASGRSDPFLLFTSPTADLQKALKAHVKEERNWMKPILFRRVKG